MGIVLAHIISNEGIDVDKAEADLIANLPFPTCEKDIQSFLGYVSFYRRFINYFNKIAKMSPSTSRMSVMSHLRSLKRY